MTEVVVTGLGAITCHGYGVARLWRAMSTATAGRPQRLRDPRAHMRLPLILPVPDPEPDPGVGPDAAGRAGRLAVAAAQEAVADAGLAPTAGTSLAVVVGSCLGEAARWEAGNGEVGPVDVTGQVFQVAARVGDELGACGPNHSVSNACAASGYAIGMAADLIRSGEADVVVAGGADAYSRVGWACFDRLGAVDPLRCRPFDRRRRGTVLAEGAGMVVLESGAHARARGAARHATLAGVAYSCDAYQATAPEPSGEQITRAMRGALAQAGAAAGVLGCVIPHGTGTPLNDAVESRALAGVLGAALTLTPLYSLKALLGHTGGAAAALALVAAALLLRRGWVPPNIPVVEPDPDCPVFLPQAGPTRLRHPRVLVNAYAFGGNNAVLVAEAAEV